MAFEFTSYISALNKLDLLNSALLGFRPQVLSLFITEIYISTPQLQNFT